MSLKDVEIKTEYRSLLDDVVKDFYNPLLKEAILYQRAVGFFSSSALIEITKGISSLVKNGGKIQIVASPYLSEKDIEAIRSGYELRDKVINEAIMRELKEARNEFENKSLNLLSNLISDEILDIRIAFTENKSNMGMYHEKMGIIYDQAENKVAFSGSMNESSTAMYLNYETIDVFSNWSSVNDSARVMAKEKAFNAIWNDREPNVRIIEFPDLKQEIIDKYKKTAVNYDSDILEYQDDSLVQEVNEIYNSGPSIPKDVKLHDYQIEAIEMWETNNFRGIFDMATGTGKTYTGLAGIVRLSKCVSNSLGVFIICPYQHLIEQWVEDIKKFGMNPLICYSSYDWKKKYRHLLNDYKLGIVRNFCVITTNVTFATDYFQKEIDKLNGEICLVVDEAHNFGAKKQLSCMKEIFKYRLALSATLERHFDEDGTKKLKDYFGKKCIEYSLERAIKEDKLCPYYYFPVPIYLEEDELALYNELTEKIAKILLSKGKDEKIPQSAEMLLIKRARIIAGARNKLTALYKIIKSEYLGDNQILVYCGATTVENSCYIQGQVEEDEMKQIEIVVGMLGNDLGMRVSRFTSQENSIQREIIKANFSEGKMLQALVAIRCLDEGVNIPGIKTAFILASSTNPKEYIQRRGRVLRKSPNKPYAKIYDFVALPRDLNIKKSNNEILKSEYSLIKREMERMLDFAELAENSSEVVKLQQRIEDFYDLNYVGGDDYEY